MAGEGRSEWKQNNPGKAAQLFLAQLSLGDDSAIVSLKALIPDRSPVEGMLNYGPEPDPSHPLSDEERKAQEENTLAAGHVDATRLNPYLSRIGRLVGSASTRK
jgi:hypothetical protein